GAQTTRRAAPRARGRGPRGGRRRKTTRTAGGVFDKGGGAHPRGGGQTPPPLPAVISSPPWGAPYESAAQPGTQSRQGVCGGRLIDADGGTGGERGVGGKPPRWLSGEGDRRVHWGLAWAGQDAAGRWRGGVPGKSGAPV